MDMEKYKLNEDNSIWRDIFNLVGTVGMFVLGHYILNSSYSFLRKLKPKKEGDCSSEIIRRLLDDGVFMKELAKIVMEAGGITKFVDKMKKSYDGDVFRWADFDDEGFIRQFGKHRVDVVKQILKSKSVQNIVKEVECGDEKYSLKQVGNQIFQWVTHREFVDAIKDGLEEMGEKIEDKVNEQRDFRIKLKSLIP